MKLRILRSFLPLFVLAGVAVADTYVVDQWGTVLRRWPWPSDRTVVIPVPGPVVPPAGWPLQPNAFVLMTPAPSTPAIYCPPAPIFRTGTPRPL